MADVRCCNSLNSLKRCWPTEHPTLTKSCAAHPCTIEMNVGFDPFSENQCASTLNVGTHCRHDRSDLAISMLLNQMKI